MRGDDLKLVKVGVDHRQEPRCCFECIVKLLVSGINGHGPILSPMACMYIHTYIRIRHEPYKKQQKKRTRDGNVAAARRDVGDDVGDEAVAVDDSRCRGVCWIVSMDVCF